MNFDSLVYGMLKTMGNAVFPQQKELGGSRGMLGNALANDFYQPPIQSPLPAVEMANPPAIKSHPMEFRNEDVLAAKTQADPKTFDQLKSSMSPTPTPNPRDNWANMVDMIVRESEKRGYDGDTIASQKALESDFGRSNFAKNKFNYGGVGAYDSSPDSAFTYESPEAYLMGKGTKGEPGYFNLIEKDPRYKQAYANRGNPERYLEELKKANYATDPDYVWKIMNTPHQPK